MLVLCLAIIGQAVWLCRATGWRVFTRFPDARLAEMNEHQAINDLFYDPVLDGDKPKAEPIANHFTFGWLPAGSGPDAISVLTIGGPAFLIGLISLVTRPRTRS